MLKFNNLPVKAIALSVAFFNLSNCFAKERDSKQQSEGNSGVSPAIVKQAKGSNQLLINQLHEFASNLDFGGDAKHNYLLAARICQARLGVSFEYLVKHRNETAPAEQKEIVRKLLEDEGPYNSHPTHPITHSLIIVAGGASIRPGQHDVLGSSAPAISRALGLKAKFLIDTDFEQSLRHFQKLHKLAENGEINQETVLKLIELGKIYLSLKPLGFEVCQKTKRKIDIPSEFSLGSDGIKIERLNGATITASSQHAKAFFEKLREGFSLKPEGGFDGELEAAILKFKTKEMPKSFPHATISGSLLMKMEELGLITLFTLQESPLMYGLSLPNGLRPDKKEDLEKIADQLFSADPNVCRKVELALHLSEKYLPYLLELSENYRQKKDRGMLEKSSLLIKALRSGIELPARIICSANGGTEPLKEILDQRESKDPKKKKYGIFTSIADHNALLNHSTPIIRAKELGVEIHYDDINSVPDFNYAISQATSDGQKLCLLDLSGHGQNDGVGLGMKNKIEIVRSRASTFDLTEDFDFDSLKDKFEEKAIWIINACNAGNGFAIKASKGIPQIYVIAYNVEVSNPNFKIVNSRSELEDELKLLPDNSRYLPIPGGKFLITTSAKGEVPILIKNGEILKNVLGAAVNLENTKLPAFERALPFRFLIGNGQDDYSDSKFYWQPGLNRSFFSEK